MRGQPVNVIIPLGGLGKRFSDEGFLDPKPFVKVLGKSIIRWVLESLSLRENDELYIIYHSSLQKANFEAVISRDFPRVNFTVLTNDTRGAAETVVKCLESLPTERMGLKTICLDGDTFYRNDIIEVARSLSNGVICFEDQQEKPIFSYIDVDEKGMIVDIAEKKKISDLANTGCYIFESGKVLENYCTKTISLGIKERGEFYISTVLKLMIQDGLKLGHRIIDNRDFVVLGTPYQVKLFSSDNSKSSEIRRFCFDVDNTILSYPEVPGDYSTCRPIEHNVDILRHLKSQGHIIILYTARRMKTHGGNMGAVVRDIGSITIDSLEKYSIPFDEIYFGKPYADFYIDDLAVNTMTNIEKQIGFYRSSIDERNFNKLGQSTIQTIVKSSKNRVALEGEIYWYENMPSEINDLFPRYLGKDNLGTKFEIEKIKGVPLSHLFLDQLIDDRILIKLISDVERIHNCDPIEDIAEIDIYANYCKKIRERYDSYDYSKFSGAEDIFNELITRLEAYQRDCLGDRTVIHGDPVFTNIIVKENQDLCFIDMRGEIGGITTLQGDKWYDYAKILQSLRGYDEILLGKFVDQAYKRRLISVFKNYIVSKYDEERWKLIKLICSSLIFSLIPLHDNDKVMKYYSLIEL